MQTEEKSTVRRWRSRSQSRRDLVYLHGYSRDVSLSLSSKLQSGILQVTNHEVKTCQQLEPLLTIMGFMAD